MTLACLFLSSKSSYRKIAITTFTLLIGMSNKNHPRNRSPFYVGLRSSNYRGKRIIQALGEVHAQFVKAGITDMLSEDEEYVTGVAAIQHWFNLSPIFCRGDMHIIVLFDCWFSSDF